MNAGLRDVDHTFIARAWREFRRYIEILFLQPEGIIQPSDISWRCTPLYGSNMVAHELFSHTLVHARLAKP